MQKATYVIIAIIVLKRKLGVSFVDMLPNL